MKNRGLRFRGLALCALLGLALGTVGCGSIERSVRIYPPPVEAAGGEPPEDPGATLDRQSTGELTVILYDSACFRGKYDGRDGELLRFQDVDWQRTHPEPSLWDSRNSLWGSKKESFAASEIAEIHERQLTTQGKWVVYPLGVAGLMLFFVYGGIAD